MTNSNWKIRQAVKALEAGGVIAYPTESIYGLGCDPWDETALIDLLAIKQRDWSKGLILIASDFNQLQDFILPLPADIIAKLNTSWPGHVTWLLPVRPGVSPLLTGFSDKIAVRVTAHPLAAQLCQAYGGPIVSTSANLSGLSPAKTAHQVRWQLPSLTYVLSGSCGGATKPSQIRDAENDEVLR